jgi:hypothetical protein
MDDAAHIIHFHLQFHSRSSPCCSVMVPLNVLARTGAGLREERCLQNCSCESGLARPLIPANTLAAGKTYRIGPRANFRPY